MFETQLIMSKKQFRPRPIDVNQPLPIISDEKILDEIEREALPISTNLGRKRHTFKIKPGAVATPLFRDTSDKITSRFSRPQNYIIYSEEEQREDLEIGDEQEYELDHLDDIFLASLNERVKARFAQSRQLRSRSSNLPNKHKKGFREKINANTDVTDDMLEQIIDGLEKEAFFAYGLRQMRDNTMDGMLCCVCNDHEADSTNVLVFCDGCNMAAHQHCYGIWEPPVATWLCARCIHRESNAVCILCGSRYGAMKPTTEGQWVHVLCALWFPETSCKDTFTCEFISGVEKIDPDRWNKVCLLCHDSNGVCITCGAEGCKAQFHVGCARAQGSFLEARSDLNENKIVLTAYCAQHSLYHLEHYPIFPRGPEYPLGNETALVAKSMGLAEEDYDIIYSYWRIKRRNHPPPLLKRLRTLTAEGQSTSRTHTEHTLKHLRFVQLRQDFERARMLVDLVRKRELAKRHLLDTIYSIILDQTGNQSEDDAEFKEQGEDKIKREAQPITKRMRRKV